MVMDIDERVPRERDNLQRLMFTMSAQGKGKDMQSSFWEWTSKKARKFAKSVNGREPREKGGGMGSSIW